MKTYYRKWGKMWKLIHTKNFWIKILKVKTNTSLQFHNYRSELHFGLNKPYFKYVSINEKHILFKGIYLEIAWGVPLENDIIRLGK